MNEALLQAKLAAEKDEIPVGAVVVHENKIIAKAHNSNRQLCDATAHAEILAIRQACQQNQSHRLDDCDIYITLEPCFMCLAAISLARIRRIYYGANDAKFGAIESSSQIFHAASGYQQLEIYSGINSQESIELLQKFFQKLRQLQSQGLNTNSK